jgi:hypothetical protein
MAEKKPLAKRRKVGIDEPLPANFDEETAKLRAELDAVEASIKKTIGGRGSLLRGRKPSQANLDKRRNLRKRLGIRREAVERATKKRLSSRKRP